MDLDTKDLPRLGDLTRTQYQDQRTLDFVRFLSCKQAYSDSRDAATHYLARFKGTVSDDLVRKVLTVQTKAAVAPGTSTDATWGGPLVTPLAQAFVALARSESLLGRIPGLRKVPFNTKIPTETTSASYSWIAESGLKPTSKLAFDNGVTLPMTKHMAIVIVTKELAQLSAPGSERALRDTLVAGLTAFTDAQFITPSVAAVAGKNPASITNGLTAIVGTADFAASMAALVSAFWTGSPGTRNPVIIASGNNSAKIRSLNAGGGLGYEVVPSEHAGINVIMLDPNRVLVADNGAVLDVSYEAAIEMDSAPVGTAAAVVRSLWQENLAGFRVERFVNWKALTGAVAYLTTV